MGLFQEIMTFSLESRHLGLIPVKERNYLLMKKSNLLPKSLSGFIEIKKSLNFAKDVPNLTSSPLIQEEQKNAS